jgi:hypothetical protein
VFGAYISLQEEFAMASISNTVAKTETDYSRQAYQILHFAFSAAPILFGVDKFIGLMTDWEKYLAPWIVRIMGNSHGLMHVIGVVEVVAGALVWWKPRWGAYVVTLWLLGIIFNLLAYPGFYDVALRDFGLLLGALALGRLSMVYQKP